MRQNYPSMKLMVSEGEGGGGERMRMRGKRRGRKMDLTSYQLLLNCLCNVQQWIQCFGNYLYPKIIFILVYNN